MVYKCIFSIRYKKSMKNYKNLKLNEMSSCFKYALQLIKNIIALHINPLQFKYNYNKMIMKVKL